jgi:GNAT superfamily N-acetyltransferase
VTLAIVPVEPRHRAAWNALFAGYAAFYRTEQTAAMRDLVWSWLHDPSHEVRGLIAERDGVPVGLAHLRRFARPLRATFGGHLDDLFVDPAHRGARVADALIEACAQVCREEGWQLLRWITADDNDRARAVYDRLATRTRWITYDKAT